MMATFDQDGQHGKYEFNIAMRKAVSKTHDRESLVAMLDCLTKEVRNAYVGNAVSIEVATNANSNLELAMAEAMIPIPDKPKLAELLDNAKLDVKNVVAVAGLYESLATLAGKVADLPF